MGLLAGFFPALEQGLQERHQQDLQNQNAMSLLNFMRQNTDSTNAANMGIAQKNIDTVRQGVSDNVGNSLPDMASIATGMASGDPGKVAQATLELNKLSQLQTALPDYVKQQTAPADIQYNTAKQMYGTNPYNDLVGIAQKNPSIIPTLLQLVGQQNDLRQQNIAAQGQSQLGNWVRGQIAGATDRDSLANAEMTAAQYGVTMPTGYNDLIFPKQSDILHVPSGEMVQQPDGSWSQVGQPKQTIGGHVELSNGDIGIIGSDGTIADTGTGFYVGPKTTSGSSGGSGSRGGSKDPWAAYGRNGFYKDSALYQEFQTRVAKGDPITPAEKAQYNAATQRLNAYHVANGDYTPGADGTGDNSGNVTPQQLQKKNPAPVTTQQQQAAWYNKTFRAIRAKTPSNIPDSAIYAEMSRMFGQ